MCKMRAKFVRIAENELSLARVVWILDTTTALERELMMFPFTSFMLQMWEMKSSCWILCREKLLPILIPGVNLSPIPMPPHLEGRHVVDS